MINTDSSNYCSTTYFTAVLVNVVAPSVELEGCVLMNVTSTVSSLVSCSEGGGIRSEQGRSGEIGGGRRREEEVREINGDWSRWGKIGAAGREGEERRR